MEQYFDIEISFKGFDSSQIQDYRHVSKIFDESGNVVSPKDWILKPNTFYGLQHSWGNGNDEKSMRLSFNSDSVYFVNVLPDKKPDLFKD